MPKPIKLTADLLQKIVEEFSQKLSTIKLSDGKVTYTKAFTYDDKNDPGAVILFEPVAYAKMLMLLHSFNSEVAWHGTVERRDARTYIIKDIIVYPQEVTGSTVTTDQERYQKWMMSLDDEVFNAMHMQGHSHVNMSVTPSSVDTALYDSILEQLTDEDYYIFLIFNKRLEYTAKIYDMATNTLFETSDVSIGIHCEEGNLSQFVTDAKAEVVTKTTTYNTGSTGAKSYGGNSYGGNSYGGNSYGGGAYGGNAYGGAYTPPANQAPAAKPSKIPSSPGFYGGWNSGDDDEVDYDEMIYGKKGTGKDVDYDESVFGKKGSKSGKKSKKDTYWWNK